MIEWDLGWSSRQLTQRADRRRFLSRLAVAGLLPPLMMAGTKPFMAERKGEAIMDSPRAQDAAARTLGVPGASLFYEVTGSGPVLLLIPGGALDADSFAFLVSPLAAHYTVVRYDPRGISRSPLNGPPEDVSVERHADDAKLLLEAVGNEPAFVFGSSGGAVIGLDLATRHPGQVRALVAHEPPLQDLLPEDSPFRGGNQALYDTYRAQGIEAAMEQFLTASGMEESGEPAPEMLEATAGAPQNFEFFIAHYLLPITSYQPDIATLRGGSPRIVVGAGELTVGQEAHDTALALAERLGTEAVLFPGDHLGYVMYADAFADSLRMALDAG